MLLRKAPGTAQKLENEIPNGSKVGAKKHVGSLDPLGSFWSLDDFFFPYPWWFFFLHETKTTLGWIRFVGLIVDEPSLKLSYRCAIAPEK